MYIHIHMVSAITVVLSFQETGYMEREKEEVKSHLNMDTTKVAGKVTSSMAMERSGHLWELYLKGIGRKGGKMGEGLGR